MCVRDSYEILLTGECEKKSGILRLSMPLPFTAVVQRVIHVRCRLVVGGKMNDDTAAARCR